MGAALCLLQFRVKVGAGCRQHCLRVDTDSGYGVADKNAGRDRIERKQEALMLVIVCRVVMLRVSCQNLSGFRLFSSAAKMTAPASSVKLLKLYRYIVCSQTKSPKQSFQSWGRSSVG